MKYDWEKDAANEVRAKVNKLNESLSRKEAIFCLRRCH
jgi:hypothetical protein